MNTFNADEGDNVGSHCFLCKKEIPPDTWFARIRVGDRRVLFCRPRCLEVFLEKDRPVETGVSLTSVCQPETKKAKELPMKGEQGFPPNLKWLHEDQ
jgi:hypothetical protein